MTHAGRNAMKTQQGERPDSISVLRARDNRVIEVETIARSDDEWKELLSPGRYEVTRKRGTERPFSGEHNFNHRDGVYSCACCGNDLFSSEDKFDSGTGWPSFTRPVSEMNVHTEPDLSYYMERTEVRCARCGAHLGHVFDDGPGPTGRRYCMNSLSLAFRDGNDRGAE